MIKFYYFHSYVDFNKSHFEDALRNSFSSYLDIDYLDNRNGIILSDETFSTHLSNIKEILFNDLNASFVFLVGVDNKNISESALNLLEKKKMTGVYTLLDLLLNKDNDFSSLYNEIDKVMFDIDYELINVAKAYILSSLNGSEAAKELFMHRNTFSYKLQNFIDKTEINIKDYTTSVVLYLYFKIYMK